MSPSPRAEHQGSVETRSHVASAHWRVYRFIFDDDRIRRDFFVCVNLNIYKSRVTMFVLNGLLNHLTDFDEIFYTACNLVQLKR